MGESLRGKLLVATPKLVGEPFGRSVVLLCAHDAQGAFGLVLNRPLHTAEVFEHLPLWRSRAAWPPVLFRGGPVEPTNALALGQASSEGPPDWVQVTDEVGLVNVSEPDADGRPPVRVRLFAGYAGWAGGQLESEIEAQAWFVAESRAEDVFSSEPERLWQEVLARQRGDLALFAHFPTDPHAN